VTLLIKESRIQSLQWAVLTFCSLGDFSDNSLLHLKKKSIYFYDIYDNMSVVKLFKIYFLQNMQRTPYRYKSKSEMNEISVIW
jgi:hypothetical protein